MFARLSTPPICGFWKVDVFFASLTCMHRLQRKSVKFFLIESLLCLKIIFSCLFCSWTSNLWFKISWFETSSGVYLKCDIVLFYTLWYGGIVKKKSGNKLTSWKVNLVVTCLRRVQKQHDLWNMWCRCSRFVINSD